jgi:23S rRNA pseudouridine2457 synthase
MPTYILYKPFGMLSQFSKEAEHHVTLQEVEFIFPKEVYPVGRLDADSEGLLLLTDDKKLNAALLHPKNKQPKTYWVQVEGAPERSALLPLTKGVEIAINGQKHKTLPAEVEILPAPIDLTERQPPIRFRKNIPTTWVQIVITEGKNRQVRRMFAAIGFPVLRLVRVGVAGLFLNQGILKDLKPGEVRNVTVKI